MIDSYSNAGVDIQRAEKALNSVKDLIKSTYNNKVISAENGFAALYELSEDQVLAAATDGVGTKLDLAIKMNSHSKIGIDLVAMVVNDLAVYGIKPLFFLDYLATSKLEPGVFAEVVDGLVEGCRQACCVLIGGETAEMPGFYPDKKYDLAGFAVGLAAKNELITGRKISEGDSLVGLASSGLHSNGYSLVRKILADKNIELSFNMGGQSLGDVLLAPTVIYSSLIQKLKAVLDIKGLAHITGGGFRNISRVLPVGTKAVINISRWRRPAIFDFIQKQGSIEDKEIFDIFNMGIGMAAVVGQSQAHKVIEIAKNNGTEAYIIGQIEKGNKEVVIQ